MKKNEQLIISKKIKPLILEHPFFRTNFAFESKYVKGKSYNPASDKSFKNELENLLVATRSLFYKIPDGGISGTPFDGIRLYKAKAFFFLYFALDKTIFVIEASKITGEKITSELAEKISCLVHKCI